MLNELALFAGIGGIQLGFKRAGLARTVCYVEREPYCVEVLKARMQDGWLDDAPVWDDVSTFDGKPWRGQVDIVSGGFPCQDLSVAGKGAGIEGARSGLWFEMLRIIREVRPRIVFVENVPGLLIRGADRVFGALAESGYCIEWDCIPASAIGANHRRSRVFVVAYAEGGRGEAGAEFAGKASGDGGHNAVRRGETFSNEDVADAERKRPPESWEPIYSSGSAENCEGEADRVDYASWWAVEPEVGRLADGVSCRVDRLRALGNAVVPQVAEYVGRRIRAWLEQRSGLWRSRATLRN